MKNNLILLFKLLIFVILFNTSYSMSCLEFSNHLNKLSKNYSKIFIMFYDSDEKVAYASGKDNNFYVYFDKETMVVKFEECIQYSDQTSLVILSNILDSSKKYKLNLNLQLIPNKNELAEFTYYNRGTPKFVTGVENKGIADEDKKVIEKLGSHLKNYMASLIYKFDLNFLIIDHKSIVAHEDKLFSDYISDQSNKSQQIYIIKIIDKSFIMDNGGVEVKLFEDKPSSSDSRAENHSSSESSNDSDQDSDSSSENSEEMQYKGGKRPRLAVDHPKGKRLGSENSSSESSNDSDQDSDSSSENSEEMVHSEKFQNSWSELDLWIHNNVNSKQQYSILYTIKVPSESSDLQFCNELLRNLKVHHTIVLVNKSTPKNNPLIITITKNNSYDTLKIYKKSKKNIIFLHSTINGEISFAYRSYLNGKKLSVTKGKTRYNVENFYIIGELSNDRDISLSPTKLDTSTTNVYSSIRELLNDQFHGQEYSYKEYDSIPLESKVERLREFTNKCKTNDLFVFIRSEFFDDHNMKKIKSRINDGLILKAIGCTKDKNNIFEIKYIKMIGGKSEFSIIDPHLTGKILFVKRIGNSIRMRVKDGADIIKTFFLDYYKLILSTTQGESL